MENEADVIRDEMAETRTALSDKLERLQDHVVGTVEDTTRTVTETVSAVQEAVEGTVGAVKETVQDTVGAVKETVQDTVETVKSTFDLSEQTQKHPWLMVGGAVAVGYIGGRLLMGHDSTALPPPSDGSAAAPPPSRTAVAAEAVSHVASKAASGAASWLEELTAPLLKEAEGLALGVLAGVAADLIQSSAPEGMRGQLNEMVQKFASSAGTKPIRGLFTGDQAGQAQACKEPAAGPTCSRSSAVSPVL